MSLTILIGTAVGLSMDACAVAISRSLANREASWRDAITMGAVFGIFQGAMPCLGYLVGREAMPYIESIDHWIIFILLAAIGAKMLWEARATQASPHATGRTSFSALLVLGFATSVDALAAGFTLVALDIPLALAAPVIAGVTFILVTACAHWGRHLGMSVGRMADAFGGLLLIGLGAWILSGHLMGRSG